MSIKITIDSNFFNAYENYADSKIKGKIRNAFISNRLSFYPSLQLIVELFTIYRTQRKHLLPKFSALFLDMMGHRCLNDWNRIIRNELGLEHNEGLFLTSDYVKKLKNILEALSKGKIYNDIKEVVREETAKKDKTYHVFKDSQEHHFRILKQQKIKTPRMSFDDFYNESYTLKIRKDLIEDLFSKANKPITTQKVNNVIDNPQKYPYFYATCRVFMGIFYRHIVLKQKVGKGDKYDQYYLIYLTGLDYLVSEDKALKKFAEYILGKQKVINFSELIKLIK